MDEIELEEIGADEIEEIGADARGLKERTYGWGRLAREARERGPTAHQRSEEAKRLINLERMRKAREAHEREAREAAQPQEELGMEVTGIIEYKQQGDILIGTLRLQTVNGGWMNFAAALPIGPVFAEVKKAIKEGRIRQDTVIAGHAPDLLEIGFGWSDIIDGAKSLAKKITKNRVTEQIAKIVNDPKIAAGIGLASTVFPPLGATYGAVRAGSLLLDKVNQGVAGAKERLAQITDLAKQGLPAGVAAHGLLKNLWEAKKYEPSPGVPYPAPGCPPYRPPPILAARAIAAPQYRMPFGVQRAAAPRRRGGFQDWLQFKYGAGRGAGRARRGGGFWRRGIPGATVSGHLDGADVAGWAWNVPYRGNLQRAIQPSPGAYIRRAYRQGLTPPS